MTSGERRQASSSAQVPRMFVSKVEIGLRLAIADDRLGRQVDDRVDLVLAEGPLEHRLVAHVAADQLDPVGQAAADELALGHPVADQADDVGPGSSRRRTSQPPTRPVAPVTRVGRSLQKCS